MTTDVQRVVGGLRQIYHGTEQERETGDKDHKLRQILLLNIV